MADPKVDAKEAQDILDALKRGETLAPAEVKAAPRVAQNDEARSILDEIAKTKRAATPAVPAKKPPTDTQMMASPIMRGLGALSDIPNVLYGVTAKMPNALDFAALAGNEEGRKLAEHRHSLGDQWLARTGDNGWLAKTAREQGLTPEDPDWRPLGWFNRAMYDTTNLATQFLGGGALSKGLRWLGGALPTSVKTVAPVAAENTGALSMANDTGAVMAKARDVQTAALAPGPGKRDLLAPFIGGVTGSTAHSVLPEKYRDTGEDLAMGLSPMTAYLPKPRMPNFFRSPGYKDTGEQLAGYLGASPRQLIEEYTAAAKNRPNIPEWSPTPGGIMDNPALLGLERQQADKATPIRDPLDPTNRITPAALRQRNTGALQGELHNTAPEGAPKAATDEMGDRIAGVRETAASRARTLEEEAARAETEATRAQGVVNATLPPIAPGERTAVKANASQELFEASKRLRAREESHAGTMFDAADPERSATVPFYRMRDAMDAIKKDAIETGRTDAIPSVMRKPKDAEGNFPPDKIDDYLHSWEQHVEPPKFLADVPYQRVKGLRTKLTEAMRASENPTERGYLGDLIKGIDNSVGESTLPGLKERYDAARDYFRENVAKPFREGPMRDLLKNDKGTLAGQTLLAPGERGAENIKRIAPSIQKDPELYKAMVDYARADMAAFTTDVNGKVNGARLKEWIDKHSPALQPFPELQKEFGRIATAQRSADEYAQYAATRSPHLRALADRGIANTEDAIKQSAARFYLNAEPEDVVRRIVNLQGSARGKMAEQAMRMLKTPAAREGLSRAYYNSITERALGGENRVQPKGGWRGTFSTILDKEADVAEKLLTPGVRNRMLQLERANVMDTARDRARANVGARTAEDMTGANNGDLSVGHRLMQSLRDDLPTVMGGAVMGGAAGSFLPLAGTSVGAGVGAATAWGARHLAFARTAAKEAALREAIFNPDIFEKVMSSASLAEPVKKRMMQAIRPYVVIANQAAQGDQHADH